MKITQKKKIRRTKMKVKLIVEGGAMKPGPAISQQLGPAGINLGKVIADVNAATAGFKGMNVPVEIDVDTKSKTFTIKVSSPSMAELMKKEAGIEKGSGSALANKVANMAFERVLSVAKTKSPALLAKDLKAAVKLAVGTCVSLGILIDNKEAKDIEKDIDAGKYDKEIKNEITEVSDQKKKDLADYFSDVKSRQEKAKKAAEEAAAAAEAAKAAAATAAPAAGAAPAAATAAPAAGATPAAAAKKEEKPAAKKK